MDQLTTQVARSGRERGLQVQLAICGMALLLLSAAGAAQHRWVLPVPDGGADVQPSPPSIHGFIARVMRDSVSLTPDERHIKPGAPVKIALTPKTQFFTAYGGPYERGQLRSGLYLWVWFLTPDPSRAGKPPRAAVLMLWSMDPSDRPSEKVRWSFDHDGLK